MTVNSQGDEDLFHDEKNFARFVRDMSNRFPKLAELTAESGGDKNETINITKANEVHAAVVGGCKKRSRRETRTLPSSTMARWSSAWSVLLANSQITERLKYFPISSARCKKIYDKYFKKGSGEISEKKIEVPGINMSPLAASPPIRVLKVYEKMHQALENWVGYNYDSAFDVVSLHQSKSSSQMTKIIKIQTWR